MKMSPIDFNISFLSKSEKCACVRRDICYASILHCRCTMSWDSRDPNCAAREAVVLELIRRHRSGGDASLYTFSRAEILYDYFYHCCCMMLDWYIPAGRALNLCIFWSIRPSHTEGAAPKTRREVLSSFILK